jgi:capsular polysaccharide transport system permease protein
MPANAVAIRNAEAAAGPQSLLPATSTAAALPLPAASGGPVLPGPVLPGAPRLLRSAVVRRRRLSLTLLSFLVVVVMPTALAAVYYLLIAADQYVAEFRFGLRSAEPVPAENMALLAINAAPLQTALDSYAVAQYIASRAIVDDLDRKLDLRRMFSTPAADWPARLHLPVTVEELVTYWQRQVDAFFDPTNGTILVRVRAFTPTEALGLAQAVLASSERLVNALSERARRDALQNSQADAVAAERRLGMALAHLRDYRDRQGLIDPRKAADANAALSARLRDELAHARANLATLLKFMAADAPALKLLQARIDSLKAQQSAVESEATETARSRQQALSRLMGSYDELESERHFAETSYQHALEALDRARINADRQQIYVDDFVPPSLPEKSLYPRRWRSLGLVFGAALVVWAIGNLTIRSVRDHL